MDAMNLKSRSATSGEWLAIEPVLDLNELGIETDTRLFKIGDGIKKWSDLKYAPRSLGQFTECRPLLIGGIGSVPIFEPPVTKTPFIVDEKRIVLNGGADQMKVGDIDASFGGIVLKGFRDHFWLYDYANNAWNTSDNVNLSCETGLLIDNRKALDEQKVRVGNRTKSGKFYLGSGEHETWRIGTDDNGNLIAEYRRLDGQWVFKAMIAELDDTDHGIGLCEAANPYIERTCDDAKIPSEYDPSENLGQKFWPMFVAQPVEGCKHGRLKVKLFLNTDDAFALGRIMKRTVNFNGVIPGPLLVAEPGDVIEIDFYNEIDDLGELEPWNDGMMQRHQMLHMHLDDRVYDADREVDENIPDDLPQNEKDQIQHKIDEHNLLLLKATTWMQHVMARGSTNLHTHGFHVRPDSFGDNVMRSVKPGSRLRYRYKLPLNHFGGLQWFHPHGHGGSQNVITRGAIGTILINGPYQNRLKSSQVEREYIILQRIEWGDNLNGRDELNWVDYVSNLQPDMNDPNGTNNPDGTQTTPNPLSDVTFTDDEMKSIPEADRECVKHRIQGILRLDDLSPYYRDNLDPKCICSCAALGGAVHVHGDGTDSMATPACEAVDVRWVPSVNGQKQPKFTVKEGEIKIFSMLNGSGLTFFRISIVDHDIIIVGRDGIPAVKAEIGIPGADRTQGDSYDENVSYSPDFVRNPAGIRLDYVICNTGQRFEFFAVPKSNKKDFVKDGQTYPIFALPVSETEGFSKDDPTVKIATLQYKEKLPSSAKNHICHLATLLPSVAVDDVNHSTNPDNANFPIDRSGWKYIEKRENLDELLAGLSMTSATIQGAKLTLSDDGLTATIVMPNDQPHHLEADLNVFVTTDAGKTVYVIDSIDPKDRATFTIKVPDGTKATLPASGIIDFEYDFFKESIINNFDTNNTDLPIFEILTEQFYYHNIDLTQVIDPKCNPKLTYIDRFKPYIVRRRHMSFAIHKQGLADSGSGSTLMNGMAFDEFNRTVAYLGTNEEILIENLSDVIHLFHIHINYFQVMGYRDSGFRENVVDHPVISDSGQYAYRTEIPVPFEGFEDTVTIPVGRVKAGDLDAVEGARGQVRVRISHEDYTGIFLMHCHLLDDQDMGMMQQVEVVTFGYEQPNVADGHHSHG